MHCQRHKRWCFTHMMFFSSQASIPALCVKSAVRMYDVVWSLCVGSFTTGSVSPATPPPHPWTEASAARSTSVSHASLPVPTARPSLKVNGHSGTSPPAPSTSVSIYAHISVCRSSGTVCALPRSLSCYRPVHGSRQRCPLQQQHHLSQPLHPQTRCQEPWTRQCQLVLCLHRRYGSGYTWSHFSLTSASLISDVLNFPLSRFLFYFMRFCLNEIYSKKVKIFCMLYIVLRYWMR